MNLEHLPNKQAILEMVMKKLQELDDEIEFNSNAWQETLMDIKRIVKQL